MGLVPDTHLCMYLSGNHEDGIAPGRVVVANSRIWRAPP